MLLALPGIVLASPPTETVFVISGQTVDPGEVTYHGSVARFKGLEAEGTITGSLGLGPLEGEFYYTENGTVNLATGWGTNQGFMTMTITEGCHGSGTIDVRFEGRTQIDLLNGVAIIADQPFTILKGTGGCAGIHGQGTRNAIVPLGSSSFTVTYTAKVHWDPQ